MNKLIPKCQNNGGNAFGNMGKTRTKQITVGTSPYKFTTKDGSTLKGYWITDKSDGKLSLVTVDKNGKWSGVGQTDKDTFTTTGNVNFIEDQNLVGENGEELTVTPKGSSWLNNNYRSAYHGDDVIEFTNAMTLGGLNNLSPTLWARRMYDTKHLINGDWNISDYYTKSWTGNNGIVSNKFAEEHPIAAAGVNLLGDGLTFGAASGQLKNMYKLGNIKKMSNAETQKIFGQNNENLFISNKPTYFYKNAPTKTGYKLYNSHPLKLEIKQFSNNSYSVNNLGNGYTYYDTANKLNG